MHIFDQFNAWKISWKYRDILHHIEISWNIVCIVKKQYCSWVVRIIIVLKHHHHRLAVKFSLVIHPDHHNRLWAVFSELPMGVSHHQFWRSKLVLTGEDVSSQKLQYSDVYNLRCHLNDKDTSCVHHLLVGGYLLDSTHFKWGQRQCNGGTLMHLLVSTTALTEVSPNVFHNSQCFRKSPQLRTWSACGPNWWNGPHLGRISLKRSHFPILRGKWQWSCVKGSKKLKSDWEQGWGPASSGKWDYMKVLP